MFKLLKKIKKNIPDDILKIISFNCKYKKLYYCDICLILKKKEPEIYFFIDNNNINKDNKWIFYNKKNSFGLACPDCCNINLICDKCGKNFSIICENPYKFKCCDYEICKKCFKNYDNNLNCPIHNYEN